MEFILCALLPSASQERHSHQKHINLHLNLGLSGIQNVKKLNFYQVSHLICGVLL